MKSLVLNLLVAVTLSGCLSVPGRSVRPDPRTVFPELRPFDASQALPGKPPMQEELVGMWYRREFDVADPLFGNRQPFFASWLLLKADGTYDLVYQAVLGSRARNDPRFTGIDVRERGRFSIAAGVLSLDPESTRSVEIRGGQRARRELGNEPREYTARVDGGYLNLGGPCASYQLEPICSDASAVWASLRWGRARSLDEIPEL